MAKPIKPKVADCRKCRWRGKVVRGVSVECRFVDAAEYPAPIPWEDAIGSGLFTPPCKEFKARPVRRKAKGGK